MHLNHAEISGVTMASIPPSLGVLMTVVIDVHNPNGYDVAVRAMRGQTMMADKYPLPVDYRAPGDGLWLPAGQTTSVRIPMTMPLPLAMALVQEAFQTPVIPYRFTGHRRRHRHPDAPDREGQLLGRRAGHHHARPDDGGHSRVAPGSSLAPA